MQKALTGLFEVLTYVDIVFFFALVVVSLLRFGSMPAALKLFTVFEALVFVVVLVSLVMAKLSIPNTLLFHLVFFVQLAWMTAYYHRLLAGNSVAIVVAAAGGVAMAGALVYYILFWADVKTRLGGTLYFASALLYVGYVLLFYATALGGKTASKYPYINAAVLLYFSGSSVIFLFGSYLTKIEPGPQTILWIFGVLLHIAFVALIFLEIWKTLYRGRKVLSG